MSEVKVYKEFIRIGNKNYTFSNIADDGIKIICKYSKNTVIIFLDPIYTSYDLEVETFGSYIKESILSLDSKKVIKIYPIGIDLDNPNGYYLTETSIYGICTNVVSHNKEIFFLGYMTLDLDIDINEQISNFEETLKFDTLSLLQENCGGTVRVKKVPQFDKIMTEIATLSNSKDTNLNSEIKKQSLDNMTILGSMIMERKHRKNVSRVESFSYGKSDDIPDIRNSTLDFLNMPLVRQQSKNIIHNSNKLKVESVPQSPNIKSVYSLKNIRKTKVVNNGEVLYDNKQLNLAVKTPENMKRNISTNLLNETVIHINTCKNPENVSDKILPLDFEPNLDSRLTNIESNNLVLNINKCDIVPDTINILGEDKIKNAKPEIISRHTVLQLSRSPLYFNHRSNHRRNIESVDMRGVNGYSSTHPNVWIVRFFKLMLCLFVTSFFILSILFIFFYI